MLALLSNSRKKKLAGEQGFTLIELLVVVVILGILIAIAIPVYLNYRQSAQDKAAQSDLRNAISVLEVCNSDGGYPSAVDNSTFAMTGCTSQSLKMSSGTQIKYTPNGSTSYVLATNNSGGSGKIYCYDSAAGGSVKTSSSTGKTQAAVTAVTTC